MEISFFLSTFDFFTYLDFDGGEILLSLSTLSFHLLAFLVAEAVISLNERFRFCVGLWTRALAALLLLSSSTPSAFVPPEFCIDGPEFSIDVIP